MTYIHHHHRKSTTVSCKTECQRPDWAICPLVHVEAPPGAEPSYVKPGMTRGNAPTFSSDIWGLLFLALLVAFVIFAVAAAIRSI